MGPRLLPTSGKLWNDLKELFRIIDQGSPPLSVATFNGGLFDPARHPFLEEHAVGDAHLQEAIDRLSRVNGEFVDYRALAERHLGTSYEGLPEFHLVALDEPEEGWTVALLNDSGERKATGNHYTPDFVVKYIVEATVGPVLRAAVEDARGDEEKVEAILGLNVLDPSMGSGHFLVEVTEYIARFLVELDVSPEEVAEDAEDDAELAYWKRRVVQSCVYGLDMNPLAVDLAKLSLWLSTVACDRPLSFLDHHLRTGNSLVGARLTDLHRQQEARPEESEAGGRGPALDARRRRLPAEHEEHVGDRGEPSRLHRGREAAGAALRTAAREPDPPLSPPRRPRYRHPLRGRGGPFGVATARRLRHEQKRRHPAPVPAVARHGARYSRRAAFLPLEAGVPGGLLRPAR